MANIINILLCVFAFLAENTCSAFAEEGINFERLQKNATVQLNKLKLEEMIKVNDTLRFFITEQMLYCPMEPMCTISSLGTKSFCCSQCSCDNSCFQFGTCCLDKFFGNGIFDINHSPETKCVAPQLVSASVAPLNNNEHYFMIGKCDHKVQNKSIENLCINDQQVPREKEVLSLLPVSSIPGNKTYQNIYCAYCNGEYEENLIFWKTALACVGSTFIVPNKSKDFLTFIFEDKTCNMLFLPPNDDMSHPCNPNDIDKCNISGDWRSYSVYVEWACHNYYNPFKPYENSPVYKNIFCYLCNTYSPFPTLCDKTFVVDPLSDGIESFLALFNYFEETDETERKKKDDTCPYSTQYDTYQDICREITCMKPFVHKEGRCVNVYDLVASQRYEVFLRFRTMEKFHEMCGLCDEFSRKMMHMYLETVLTKMKLLESTCSISILFSNDTCDVGHKVGSDFILAHIELFIKSFHDPLEVARKFLNSTLFEIVSNDPWMCIDPSPCVVDGYFYDIEPYTTPNKFTNPDTRKYTDPLNGKSLTVDSNSGECLIKPWVTRLTKTLICPLVNLSIDNVDVSIHSNQVCLYSGEICIPSDEYVYHRNNSYILVCAESYFSRERQRTEILFGRRVLSFLSSCLSILCLIITLVTYSLFPVLRTLPGLFTMALCATLIAAHISFTFGLDAVHIHIGCEILGIIIHFTILASAFLMNVCSINMFKVFRHHDLLQNMTKAEKKRQFIFGLIYSYATSGFFVTTHAVYNVANKGNIGYGENMCFINGTINLFFFLVLPVIAIILANVIMFCVVIRKVNQIPDMSVSTTCHKSKHKFIIYFKLSSIIGIAWLFGGIAELIDINFLVYIFIILTAGQGIFIMISFVLNKRVYHLYCDLIKNKKVVSATDFHARRKVFTRKMQSYKVRNRSKNINKSQKSSIHIINAQQNTEELNVTKF